jgi:hypothetical protein
MHAGQRSRQQSRQIKHAKAGERGRRHWNGLSGR